MRGKLSCSWCNGRQQELYNRDEIRARGFRQIFFMLNAIQAILVIPHWRSCGVSEKLWRIRDVEGECEQYILLHGAVHKRQLVYTNAVLRSMSEPRVVYTRTNLLSLSGRILLSVRNDEDNVEMRRIGDEGFTRKHGSWPVHFR